MPGDKPLSQEDIDRLMQGGAPQGEKTAAKETRAVSAKLDNLVQETGVVAGSSIEMLMDVPMEVTIELGRAVMTITRSPSATS